MPFLYFLALIHFRNVLVFDRYTDENKIICNPLKTKDRHWI